jgi:hypothetical protein
MRICMLSWRKNILVDSNRSMDRWKIIHSVCPFLQSGAFNSNIDKHLAEAHWDLGMAALTTYISCDGLSKGAILWYETC